MDFLDEIPDCALNVLKRLEAEGDKYWNVPFSTGILLMEMVKFLQAKTVLEIGTSTGLSGIFFALGLKETGGKLFTIESHKERFEMARINFEEAGVQDFVEQIKGHAPEIIEQVKKDKLAGDGVDIAFFDATKMEYVSYLDSVFPLLNPGGFIIADNCLTHKNALGEFFDAVKKMGLKNFLLPIDNGLFFTTK